MEAPQESRDFVLERYKSLQLQIAASNEAMFKILGVYQGLSTAIIGAAVFVMTSDTVEHSGAAKELLIGLRSAFQILSGFAVLMIITHVLTWFDLRSEETRLLDTAVHVGFKARPTLANAWRWPETYVLIAIVAFAIGVTRYFFGALLLKGN